MIKQFKQNASSHLVNRPNDDWEWIFLMQHYRAFTRLLDWSESPLVALFFALFDERQEQEAHDAALWFLDPITLNRNSNAARRSFELDIPACGIDEELNAYLPDQVNARRVLLDPIAIIGPRNSSRMAAQSGSFTIMHYEPKPIEAIGDTSHVWRMIIPSESKPKLRKELRLLGISEYSLFPELDRVSSLAKALFE
jgi:hypothetical protein